MGFINQHSHHWGAPSCTTWVRTLSPSLGLVNPLATAHSIIFLASFYMGAHKLSDMLHVWYIYPLVNIQKTMENHHV